MYDPVGLQMPRADLKLGGHLVARGAQQAETHDLYPAIEVDRVELLGEILRLLLGHDAAYHAPSSAPSDRGCATALERPAGGRSPCLRGVGHEMVAILLAQLRLQKFPRRGP